MSRKPGKSVLYEVIRQNQTKITIGQKIKDLRSKKGRVGSNTGEKTAEKVGVEPKKAVVSWPPRRRGLSVLLEKIIFSRGIFSKINPIRTIIILLVIMGVLAGVKIGQNRTKTENSEAISGSNEFESGSIEESLPSETKEDLISAQKVEEGKTDNEEAIFGPIGNHVIVIMTYDEKRDLEPVKEFFAKKGINTVIEKRGDYYFLLTKEYYQSPQRGNSDGYKALEKIKRIGAVYQAPIGYETFGSTPFQDAYGMKIR